MRSFREPCQNSHDVASRISLSISFCLSRSRLCASFRIELRRRGDRGETEVHAHLFLPLSRIPTSRHVTEPVPLIPNVSVDHHPSCLSWVPPLIVPLPTRPPSRFFSVVKRSTLVLRTVECYRDAQSITVLPNPRELFYPCAELYAPESHYSGAS